ncbi:MAG: DUF3160 domain-containing protein [Calditrichaeota bacterium]|nr:DUF3160 domain-containing protein [Calditrichota bacterium]
MRAKIHFLVVLLLATFTIAGYSQANFDVAAYSKFLQEHQNMETGDIQTLYPLQQTYFKGNNQSLSISDYSYLDSVIEKLELTTDELDLLGQNHFFATERLSYSCFGEAFHKIYGLDLPVFVSTDAILQAVHNSYDLILMDLEIAFLEQQLSHFLESLYQTFPQLLSQYQNESQLSLSLEDVDLYVTIAYSLSQNSLQLPQYTNQEKVQQVWNAIFSEQMTNMALFSEHVREIDFSQFKPRGHYNQLFFDPITLTERTLENYFRTMMWLGRIDFLLTPPPSFSEQPWTESDLKRMTIDAFLVNELLDLAGVRNLLDQNNQIIDALVGESDNLTPTEFVVAADSAGIHHASDLLDDSNFRQFQQALSSSVNSSQRILSNFFIMDPFASEPDTLPVSFKLMGQRFVLDSYIFSQIVYDRIIFNGRKIWRPMPDPLDAMFVLGNDDALYLLSEEITKYKYASQLAALRYLTDAYDDSFWQKSVYNLWLNALRSLNPAKRTGYFPIFTKTAAWHQQKLNSQLASWSQLRHDNLLYAKQSYTGGTVCSYPHSFVEPNLSFFTEMKFLAENAGDIFQRILPQNNPLCDSVIFHWQRFAGIMGKLKEIVRKEINRENFTDEEIEFLQRMLFKESGSGAPPFSGWYADLFYGWEKGAKIDYLVADVHTQPTDEFGNIVGRILHVGVGQVNMGVFLADSPSNDFRPTCFVGPVMSYYEKITENFNRLTDDDWAEMVNNDQTPERPDWVNLYLTDKAGKKRPAGTELPGIPYTAVERAQPRTPEHFRVIQNYPNPFNPSTKIRFTLPGADQVKITVYDVLGKEVAVLANEKMAAGTHAIDFNASQLSGGLYFCTIQTEAGKEVIKMLLVK